MDTTDNGTMSEGGAIPAAPRRRRWRRGGLVTVGTVSALVAAMGLTVLGLGAADNAAASFDASSWLWSTSRSELARVNGITARVDTRVQVPDARSHPMQIVQTDRMLIMRDQKTGRVSTMDLATLQIMANMPTVPGLGVNVAIHEDAVFVVDTVQGLVQQLDARSLTPVGEALQYPPGITGGAFDGAGRLWIAVPSEGTVSAITAAKPPVAAGSGGGDGGAGDGSSPTRVHTLDVAEPNHELLLSTLDDGVAVLDRTGGVLATVRGEATAKAQLSLAGPAALPAHTSGALVPVTVPDEREVHVVDGEQPVARFTVPGGGATLSPAVAWADRFYCPDETTGKVYVFDANGELVDTIAAAGRGGPLELEVRENHLFINSPQSSTAQVVDDKHSVRSVDKYANDVLGGDPPPEPPAAAPPPPAPKKPQASKPGAPRSVSASAGDASARVNWQPAAPNGAAITKYIVTGAERPVEVGANQRSIELTGLTNGQTYRFTVQAVNAKGTGPAGKSNPVVPTAEVPDAPASVTAEARPDGTVAVSWPEANGQGNKIAKYAVTAVSEGTNAPVGEAPGTELVIPAGTLTYGSQYAFTVVAISDGGAGSKASPPSGTVVPFTLPDAPAGLQAATVADRPGTISVRWDPAVDNGRPVTAYQVEAGGRTTEVTTEQATLGDLGNGQNVQINVRAVNEAGPGPQASATARTVALPQVTITRTSVTATSVTVAATVDAGGGSATCTLSAAGAAAKSGSCASLTLTGLTPSTRYTVKMTATNAAGAGSANATATTAAVYGIATCVNGSSGDQRTYCDADRDGRNGNEVFSVPRQDNDRQVGWAKPGTRWEAYCKVRGEEVYAFVYNKEKRSTWWVRINYSGSNYIPWAWFNLEGDDDLALLPTC